MQELKYQVPTFPFLSQSNSIFLPPVKLFFSFFKIPISDDANNLPISDVLNLEDLRGLLVTT